MATTPTVYVICDQNCKFEGMTKEQILTAIMQAVNEGTIGNIDAGFITTIKTINGRPLKFFAGEQAEFDALTDEEKNDLFAIITNDVTKEGIIAAIEELQTNYKTLIAALTDGSFAVTAKNAQYATSAGSATNAQYATSATKDDAGNNIVSTYAKKESLTDGSLVVKTAKCSNAVKCYSASTIEGMVLNEELCVPIVNIPDELALIIFEFYSDVYGCATACSFYTAIDRSTEKTIRALFSDTATGFKYRLTNGCVYVTMTSCAPSTGSVYVNEIRVIPLNI